MILLPLAATVDILDSDVTRWKVRLVNSSVLTHGEPAEEERVQTPDVAPAAPPWRSSRSCKLQRAAGNASVTRMLAGSAAERERRVPRLRRPTRRWRVRSRARPRHGAVSGRRVFDPALELESEDADEFEEDEELETGRTRP